MTKQAMRMNNNETKPKAIIPFAKTATEAIMKVGSMINAPIFLVLEKIKSIPPVSCIAPKSVVIRTLKPMALNNCISASC